jgi:hypothetical protein
MASVTIRTLSLAAWLVALVVSLMAPTVGYAATSEPHWIVLSQPAPSAFHPGDSRDYYEIIAVNDGGAATTEPITITDTLPVHVVVNSVNAYAEIAGQNDTDTTDITSGCTQASYKGTITVTCTTGVSVPVGRSAVVNINVEVPGYAKAGENLANTATVTGGGAQSVSTSNSTPITDLSVPVPFGASLIGDITETQGKVATQAGSHPLAFTTLIAFNVAAINAYEKCNKSRTLSCASLNAQAKDIEVALPSGMVGNPTAVPYCTQAQFERPSSGNCPASSQVGGLYLYFYGASATLYAPVYSIEPPPGQPGELGFTVEQVAHIPIFFHVRSEHDYGVTTDISNINQLITVRMALLSIWGDPSNATHDPLRQSPEAGCRTGEAGCPSGVASPRPFFSLPTSCTPASLTIPLAADPWQDPEPAPFQELASSSIAGMTGCGTLSFEPAIGVSAGTHQAGAPAGYRVGLNVPQNEDPAGLATPAVHDVEVALPEGTTASPSATNGLVTCTESQFGLKVRARGNCPSASRIGSVNITTPLLANSVKGAVYIGEPECQPCNPSDAASGRMVRVLLEAEAEGVIIKQAGRTRINQSTGQLTTVFTDTPQLPFSDLEIALESGAGAPLANPTTCGPAVTNADITPWSSTSPTHIASEPIQIEGCSNGFSPAFKAGMTPTGQAGASSNFSMTLSRNDGEQTLGQVSVTTPPGLLGVLQSVEQCPEPQAKAGTCGAGSLIGTGRIVVGPGESPLTINGSRVYLTGSYNGSPFGLSIVTPAVAGPFVLAGNEGNGTEVVRASIAIDPHTGALTVTSDPLPPALNGVPLDIRTIHIDVNRPGFTFNPTNCDILSIGAVATSATGTVARTSYPFQASGCAALPFKPSFTAATQSKTSKQKGASLHVKVTSGAGQANIAKVKVDLPVQLPSRLSTLQKACVDKVFDANPASCPAASVVGSATAVTPLLKNPLTGPAYLVSHAGAAFPDLEVVLQGEGITLILDGNTQIKKGITSSTFKAVPDAPISTFDLSLPEGPHSALAAFGSLCTGKLKMPTVITGQNGAVIRQTTKITATGCPKVKAKKVTKRHKAKKGHKAKGSAKRGRSVS